MILDQQQAQYIYNAMRELNRAGMRIHASTDVGTDTISVSEQREGGIAVAKTSRVVVPLGAAIDASSDQRESYRGQEEFAQAYELT